MKVLQEMNNISIIFITSWYFFLIHGINKVSEGTKFDYQVKYITWKSQIHLKIVSKAGYRTDSKWISSCSMRKKNRWTKESKISDVQAYVMVENCCHLTHELRRILCTLRIHVLFRLLNCSTERNRKYWNLEIVQVIRQVLVGRFIGLLGTCWACYGQQCCRAEGLHLVDKTCLYFQSVRRKDVLLQNSTIVITSYHYQVTDVEAQDSCVVYHCSPSLIFDFEAFQRKREC